MLGMEDEENIKSSGDLWVRLEVQVCLLSIHHVKEILNVPKVFVWRNNWLSDSVSVTSGSNSWSASQNSVDMLVSLLLILVNVGAYVSRVALRIEGTHGCNQCAHHSHRMGVMSETLDERFKSMMIIGVLHDFLVKGFELFLVWKLTINDQESSFQES